jgi:hypothetical protein
LEIAFLSGRDFNQHDALTSERVAIVNESFARKVFGAGNPIGNRFKWEPHQARGLGCIRLSAW